LLGEVLVSVRDVIVEGRIRVLPVSEGGVHLLLFMNPGALVVPGAALRLVRRAASAYNP
jgi:hypothetical protein